MNVFVVRRLLWVIGLVVLTLSACDFPATSGSSPITCGVHRNAVYEPHRPLMERSCIGRTLYVTGSSRTSYEALRNVAVMADAMLANRPDVARRLRNSGALLGVFAANEDICDLDYFSDLRGQLNIHGTLQCDDAGLGGVPGRPTSGCSEVNALGLRNDPFRRGTAIGRNICVHEIAHLIMDVGLAPGDRIAIQRRYEQVMSQPELWTSPRDVRMFARINHQEFWAEMSQIYFSGSPRFSMWDHNGVSGPEALKEHDLATYNLVHGIYRGSADLR